MNPDQTQQPESPQEDNQLMVFLGEIADRLESIETKLGSLLGLEESEVGEDTKIES